jgi:D-alanyl-D-alanine carboxypeptidase
MVGLESAINRLDSFIEQRMHADNTPGVALALTDRGHLLHVATYGLADIADRVPVTPATLFEIGSISKSFTAIALLQLREAGRVDLHAPVTKYLPWFHVRSSYEPITLHHLLSHTAAIIMGTDFTTEARYEVWALRDTDATAPPGTTFHYSSVGYKALGLVLEELAGRTYGQIIQERILDPLGMAATVPVITHEARRRMVTGYEPLYDDRPYHPGQPLAPATWFETGTADGSIAATAADMAVYLRMLLNRGQVPQVCILTEESFGLMTQRIIRLPGSSESPASFYGYGLDVGQDGGHTIIGHEGGMVGHYSAMLADLDDGLGVVVLTNGPGAPAEMARFALKLLRATHHGETLPPPPAVPDPGRIENAADYAGRYTSSTRTFTLVAEGEWLAIHEGATSVPLEQHSEDAFYALHPDLSRFLLRFGRQQGQVVEACHGADWCARDGFAEPVTFEYPAEWEAYPGHYRSHNPWHSNFRVVLRRVVPGKGSLLLIEPWGEEQVLVPLGGPTFRIGDDERSPERLRFDTVLDGQAIRANLSGCDYYRTFTP